MHRETIKEKGKQKKDGDFCADTTVVRRANYEWNIPSQFAFGRHVVYFAGKEKCEKEAEFNT